MMNQYLKNLNKIEFVVTYACTGQCKHCSEGDHTSCGERIDPAVAADAVRRIAAAYAIETVMVFGGEPMLHPEAVIAIMAAAQAAGISHRQVITNGYFSSSAEALRAGARRLVVCGVNDLLISVDAFHQETIPLDAVGAFAAEAVRCGIPTRLQPAWLVSPEDENPYNRETRRILAALSDLDAPVGAGNVIFPEGNARRYLAEYFAADVPQNPYVEDPRDVRCISFAPNGDVLGGNIYRRDIMEIIAEYKPEGEE